jgi:hypothetical protein
MHSDSVARFSCRAFLRARPWIWIVIAYCAFVASILSFVVIAVKHREAVVPLQIHGR